MMGRTKQTARKSSGGRAPRCPHAAKAAFRWREKASVHSKQTISDANADLSGYAINIDRDDLFHDVDLSSAATRLVMGDGIDPDASELHPNSIVNMPIFDLNSIQSDDYEGPLEYYIVSRHPIVLKNNQSVSKHAEEFLEHVIDRCLLKYGKKSKWIIIWEDERQKISILAQVGLHWLHINLTKSFMSHNV